MNLLKNDEKSPSRFARRFECFTDGSSKGNPGLGGAGGIFVDHREQKITEWGGFQDGVTNNAMELWAAIEGLKWVDQNAAIGDQARIVTDSSYVVEGASKHSLKWQTGAWPEKNTQLWKELVAELERLKAKNVTVEWRRIPGHAGVLINERADEIAQGFASAKGAKSSIALYTGKIESYFVPLNFESQLAGMYSSPKYLSMVSGVFALDDSWGQCEARVKGNRSAKFKKVFNPDQVEWFKKMWKNG